MLALDSISAGYGEALVLREVSLTVKRGQIVCLFGRNGAGKTTTLRAIMGLVKRAGGAIRLDGHDLTGLKPHEIPGHGIGYVPQGRRLFTEMTVAENLEIGLMARRPDAGTHDQTRDWVLDLFPRLRERLGQRAETLSGGEQQMLATARALCLRPKVLLLDEPTEGLDAETEREVLAALEPAMAGRTVIAISHRPAPLAAMDRVIRLEGGRIVELPG